MRKSFIFVLIICFIFGGLGADDQKDKSFQCVSLAAGLSLGSGHCRISYQYGHHVFALRYAYTFDVFSEHSDDRYDLGVHYSYKLMVPNFPFEVLWGVGIAWTKLDEMWNDPNRELIGFPLEIQFLLNTGPLALGVYAFYNLNYKESYMHMGLTLQLKFYDKDKR